MYFLNVFPLEEQYINNAKKDELIIDPKTGHITICTNDSPTSFLSNSKSIEADLDGLISLKDRFYKEYLSISDSLEDAVNKLSVSKENINAINATIADCEVKLIRITQLSNSLLTLYDDQYKRYNRYLFDEMENFRLIVRENTKTVLAIRVLLDEIKILSQDVNQINEINHAALKLIADLLKNKS